MYTWEGLLYRIAATFLCVLLATLGCYYTRKLHNAPQTILELSLFDQDDDTSVVSSYFTKQDAERQSSMKKAKPTTEDLQERQSYKSSKDRYCKLEIDIFRSQWKVVFLIISTTTAYFAVQPFGISYLK